MLEIGFAELKSSYKRLAGDLGDNPFDTLGVLALVEDAQCKQPQLVTLGILVEFKGLLMHRFSKFISEQVQCYCRRPRFGCLDRGLTMLTAVGPLDWPPTFTKHSIIRSEKVLTVTMLACTAPAES